MASKEMQNMLVETGIMGIQQPDLLCGLNLINVTEHVFCEKLIMDTHIL